MDQTLYVPNKGDITNARFIIIGEMPSEHDVKAASVFSGRGGQLLDNLLSDSGISRDSCYYTNVVSHCSPTGEFKYFRQKDNLKYLQESINNLHKTIAGSKAEGILCLGSEAASAILGDRRVSARRGFISVVDGRKVIVTYNPGAVLKSINMYPVVLFDFKKIARHVKDSPHIERRHAIIRPSFQQARDYLTRLGGGKGFTFDIENTDEGIDCISFADNHLEAMSIPFVYQTGEGEKTWINNYFTEEEENIIWADITRILEDDRIPKCAQNAFYDMWQLRMQMGIEVKGLVHDTMVAAALINSEFPKDLWFLATLYTDAPFWEDKDDKLDAARWEYNALDSMITYEIWRKQENEIRDLNATDFFRTLPMSLLPHLVRSSYVGVRFDHAKRDTLLKETTAKLRERVERFKEIAGDINYNSYPQLKKYFIEEKKIDPIINKETGTPTFDADALGKIYKKYKLEEAKELITIREYETKIQFLEVKTSKDKRLRCSYNVAGTETGRLSSSEAPDRTGNNLQNWEASNRVLILPEEGCVWLKCDLSQAENRVVAYLSQDPFMIAAMESGGDIHSQIAQMIFNKKVVSKEERQLGKKIGHASNYGMGPKRLKDICLEEMGMDITLAQAKKYQSDYFLAFPKIRMWHEQIKGTLSHYHKLTNPFGRTRRFLGYWGPDLWKEAFAFLPQSTVADCCNLAFIDLCKQGLDARLQTHDEILFNVPESEMLASAARIRYTMQRPFKIGHHNISIPVEIQWGYNWYETKELPHAETGVVATT